jgi:hypothetical protein
MTWMSKIRSGLGYSDAPPPGRHEDSRLETEQIYARAKEALTQSELRRDEVQQVANDLANLRQRNHFGESFERAMRLKERTV